MRPSIEFIKSRYGERKLIGAEIGVLKGDNADYILKTLNMQKLYLVDLWSSYTMESNKGLMKLNFKRFYEAVQNRFSKNPNVIILKQSSSIASGWIKDYSLDFVYIDGNHQYTHVRNDLRKWYPKLKQNGTLCGHDFSNEWNGVMDAVTEFVNRMKLTLTVKETDWWIT